MSTQPSPTVLTMPRNDRRAMFIGLPIAGAVAAVVLPMLARWLLSFGTGLPMKPVIWFVGAIDNWWKVLVAVAIGALAGLAAASAQAERTATVLVSDDELAAEAEGRRWTIAAAEVDAVFLDGKMIVIQDTGSRRVFSAPLEAPRDLVAQAFRAHGYRWLDGGDPFAGQYRPWRRGGAELPPEVDAVLAAREAALKKPSVGAVLDLSEALHRLGYAVREEGTQQQWRPLPADPQH